MIAYVTVAGIEAVSDLLAPKPQIPSHATTTIATLRLPAGDDFAPSRFMALPPCRRIANIIAALPYPHALPRGQKVLIGGANVERGIPRVNVS